MCLCAQVQFASREDKTQWFDALTKTVEEYVCCFSLFFAFMLLNISSNGSPLIYLHIIEYFFVMIRSHERKAEVDKVEQKLQEARAEKARERGMAPVDEWKQAPTVAGLDVTVLMVQV